MVELDIRFDEAKAALVSQKDHPGQKMFVVKLDDYAVCSPFVIDGEGYVFLKTAFKARVFNK